MWFVSVADVVVLLGGREWFSHTEIETGRRDGRKDRKKQ